MRRTILTCLVALAALGGVASADHYRGNRGYRDNGGVRVEPSYPRQNYRYSRTYVRPTYRSTYRPYVRIVRGPIYVQRPVVRYRYYNYYQRPSLIVENYPARDGYLWVAGQWTWTGYEWMWQPGHYEADPSYDSQYYDSQYNQQYQQGYDNSYDNQVDESYYNSGD